MTTYKLTPKQADLVTGLSSELMGWHFVGSEADGVYASFDIMDDADWDYSLNKNPTNRKLKRLSLTKIMGDGPTAVNHLVDDTCWYALDANQNIHVMADNYVAANYDVESYTPPTAT